MAGILLSNKDPLALDLDGNGIATISANEGIVFDHNKSGVKYGTGWINSSDGWLALDRNGNGAIDSGRELFGDSTKKLDGNFAAHAYDALASFDTNKDGKVDVADATGDADSSGTIDGAETYWDVDNNGTYNADKDKTFADLRVWVDANSNVNTFKGNYTTGSGEVIDGTRSFNLVENKFHRELPGGPNIPPDVAALPNMQGSGAVRDLHEAMSLGTAESAALKATVQAFNNATTRAAQYALIDALLLQWSRTAEFEDMVDRLEDMTTTYRNNQTGQINTYHYRFALTTGEFWDDSGDTYNQRNQKVDLIDDPIDPDYARTRNAQDTLYLNNPEVLADQTPAQAAKIQALAKTRILEVFNNAQFFDFSSRVVLSGTDNPNTPEDERTQSVSFSANSNNATQTSSGHAGAAALNTVVLTEDDLPIPQSNYMHASYDQLRESVYGALALQTRLKPYFDAIQITVDASGTVAFDFTALDTLIANQLAANAVNGVMDLVDILKYRGADLEKSGWDAEAQFVLVKNTIATMSSEQRNSVTAAGYALVFDGQNPTDDKTTSRLALISEGFSGQSTYAGSVVSDVTLGSTSDDYLMAATGLADMPAGSDILWGGAGNDNIDGGVGVSSLWGGAGSDTLRGGAGDDYVSGGVGNDYLYEIWSQPGSVDGDGNDYLDGGAGDDYIQSYVGNDSLIGGEGNDRLDDQGGNNVFDGGKGHDVIIPGGLGSDFYIYRKGDGEDVIGCRQANVNMSLPVQGSSVLFMQAGILPEYLILTQQNHCELHITFADSPADKIMVANFFHNDNVNDAQNPLQAIVFANGVVWSATDIAEKVFATGAAGNDILNGLISDDVIHGGAGNDYLYGREGNDALHGDEGNDYVYGEAGNDSLYGGDGADVLSGDVGDDVLDGGAGDDILYGGTGGSDTFIFNIGTGQDVVPDVSAEDVVQLGAGINPVDILVIRTSANTLKLVHQTTGDSLSLTGDLRKVVLNDGSVLLDEEVLVGLKDKNITLKRNIEDTDGDGLMDDRYFAYSARELLGNKMPDPEKTRWQIVEAHTLSSGFGADVADVDGDGNVAEQAFFFIEDFWGSGENIIAFLPSTAEGSAAFAFDMQRNDGLTFRAAIDVLVQSGTTLTGTSADDIISGNQANESVTVNGLAGDDLLGGGDHDDWVNGYGGNDILAGSVGNDVLQGGAGSDQLETGDYWNDVGNDVLLGGSGSDTYVISNLWCGDHDTINNLDGGASVTDVDRLSLLNQIADYRELWFERDDSPETGGDDLIVTQIEMSGSVRIEDWFSDSAARLQRMDIREDDGDVYSFLLDSHFDALIQTMATVAKPMSSADISSTGYDDVRASWGLLVSGEGQ